MPSQTLNTLYIYSVEERWQLRLEAARQEVLKEKQHVIQATKQLTQTIEKLLKLENA